MNIANDMYYKPRTGNILLDINWKQQETGLVIKNITVKNYAPIWLRINDVVVSSGPGNRLSFQGPDKTVGTNGKQPGILHMDLNVVLSSTWDSNIKINFLVSGGYMNPKSKTLNFAASMLPSPGCSLLPGD